MTGAAQTSSAFPVAAEYGDPPDPGMTGPVGVVGIGMIGTVVVDGLLAADVRPVVVDRDGDAVTRAVERGADSAATVSELAARCSIVVVCVVSAAQVDEVVGEIATATADRRPDERPVVVVHSTVGPEAITELAARAPELRLVDAPVSDNRTADVHRLFVFVGVRGDLPAGVAATFGSYSHGYRIMGDLGAGQLLKLVCNTISLVTSSAVAEAMALCSAYGIDPTEAAEVAGHGSAASWVLANWAELSPRAPIVRKDLAAAVDTAARKGVAMPVTSAARDASATLFGGETGSRAH